MSHLATGNTNSHDGKHRYETNLDIACDLVALKEGELNHKESVTLVEYLTSKLFTGRSDATAQQLGDSRHGV